ncbi:4-hydroxyphenylpyruvate dioxygenase [Vulgatibacter sp.]|uniref:4-hydroxyphenylpyruvate dioxygenase n=1 Tax=Vulgatibacter sp. TaxID=1971226 RepID=UPI00356A4141
MNGNPLGMRGLAFVEYASAAPEKLGALFADMGFVRIGRHRSLAVDHYRQNGIHFFVNHEPGTHAAAFTAAHGPCVCSLGLLFEDAQAAFDEAVRRGAKPFQGKGTFDVPAIHGIGDAVLYFVEASGPRSFQAHFESDWNADVRGVGFLAIDHLTNNVHRGTLGEWQRFYQEIFGFTEVRHFDIRGEETGLFSYALRSPDGSFCIPINEGKEEKSQIDEYLREYKGPGVQHIALTTEDILGTLDRIGGKVVTLDIDDEYYATVFDRVHGVTEDPERIRQHQVLVDGDDAGYLLQIFSQNVIGPIFFEFIQRRNHQAFGEGNFGALFRSIERDQKRRGVL